MTEPPKSVVCTSCSAKFHVPDELIRGKLVKFRCRKCGEGFDVDGRRSARPPAPSVPPPAPPREVTGVDTPATFSQRTLPPPRPPVALSKSSPNLHPWPEPPRTRSSTTPTAISDSVAPPEESLPRLDSLPRLETARDPSNRGPKIAAIVALLIAAGLSGFGLAMRSSPAVRESRGQESATLPADPQSAALRAQRPAGEPKIDHPSRAQKTPTPVTQLPAAVDGIERAPTAGGMVANPLPAVPDEQEPSHGEATALPPSIAANGGDGPAVADPSAINAGTTLPPPASPPPAVAAPPLAARARGDFNIQAAREALEDAAGRAGKCRNMDSPSGTARVAVTFAPSGQVTTAVIESGPFVGTAAGSCVASKFRSARVPPFSGDSVLVRKSVPF